jgi:hypothetical protein
MGEKKKKEEGKRGGWRGEKEESCVGGGENGGAGEGGELPHGRRGGKEVGEGKWGEKEEKGRRCGPAGGHAPPPIPNVLCMDMSPFGDVWHYATLANADVAFYHITIFVFFKKFKCMSCMHIYIHTHVTYAWAACILIYFEICNYESL